MSIRLEDDLIRLDGDCHVEQAEVLVRLLQEDPARRVDLSNCRRMHGALAQVLLAFGAIVCGTPDASFLCDFVQPNFRHLSPTSESSHS